MRPARNVVSALVLFVLSTALLATDAQKFDGKWLTTVSCANYRDALGFSYQFVSTVKDGVFHGVHGTEGEPGSLVIDGKIPDDGKASLYAKGRTGSKEYVRGRDTPRGTEYGYNIDAHFDGSAGTGTRVEGRPCSLKFAKAMITGRVVRHRSRCDWPGFWDAGISRRSSVHAIRVSTLIEERLDYQHQ